MSFPRSYQKAECKTIDGTIIGGWLYAVEGRAPTIIMTPGVSILHTSRFNCVKEMLLPEIAERFQSVGYNALI